MSNEDRNKIEENPVNQKGTKNKRKPVKKTKIASFKPTDGSKKNLILIGAVILIVIVLSGLIFATLSALFSTETYYVLNTNVKAKQEITPDMVAMRETAAGTGPVNALSMESIQRGGVYARYPLYAGDVIANSNAGALSGQTLGVPDTWSTTSFTLDSTNAVGGTLGKGDYVDLLGVDENHQARYIFNNLLILDVKFVSEEYDDNASGEAIVGETMHYTLGMPAEDVAYFHSAISQYNTGGLRLIKAPYSLNYAKRDVSDLDTEFKYGPAIGNIDLFLGTDPTFTEVERDELGRPLNIVEYEEIFENEDETKSEENKEIKDEEKTEDNGIIEIEAETDENKKND